MKNWNVNHLSTKVNIPLKMCIIHDLPSKFRRVESAVVRRLCYSQGYSLSCESLLQGIVYKSTSQQQEGDIK